MWVPLACQNGKSWWRHQMETFSTLLAICAGNSSVNGEFPAQRPVTRSFDVFFDLRLNKRLSKQSWGWWFETLSRPLWRHCNVSQWARPRLVRFMTHGNDFLWRIPRSPEDLPHKISVMQSYDVFCAISGKAIEQTVELSVKNVTTLWFLWCWKKVRCKTLSE